VLLSVTYVATTIFPLRGETAPQSRHSQFYAWYHWDAVAYIRIARQGYASPSDVAFFPFWSLLIRGLGGLFGGSIRADYLAGLLLANACFYAALVLLYHLLATQFAPEVARIALICLAFQPYALFFFAGYTESLFLLLCVAVFLLLRRDDAWSGWLAGGLGFFAALTRQIALALAVPMVLVAVQRFCVEKSHTLTHWLRLLVRLIPIALVPAGILAYMLYLGHTRGDPLVFAEQEGLYWHRHLALPWVGTLSAIHRIVEGRLVTMNLLDITFTLLPLIALAATWRRLPMHFSFFALSLALLALCFPSVGPEPLNSAPRYLLVAFPLFAAYALWCLRPRGERIYLAISLPVLILNSILFVCHYRIA
jgi:hypothetical protein